MSQTRLSIAHVASEMAPLVKVGGLADMVGALAAEQVRRGHRVIVALPGYRDVVLPPGWTVRPLGQAEVPWGLRREPAAFEVAEDPGSGLRVLLVRHTGERRFFDRPGVYDDTRTNRSEEHTSELQSQ